MDVAAVSSATHECLTDLGLRAKGDIFALKAFCHRRQLTFTSKNVVQDNEKNDYEDRKKKLLAQLQTANQKKRNKSIDKHSGSSMSRGPVEKYKTRKISLGWLHYSDKKERFVAVRLNSGGGTRKLDVGSHFSKEMLIEEGKKLFYPNGESSEGQADDMIFDLANFKGENIDIPGEEDNKQPFSIQKYIEMNKLTQVRLYLTTRHMPFASSDVDDVDRVLTDEDIEMSTLDNDRITIESESENDDEVLMHPVFDSGTTLIGSSEERQKLMEEQDQLFQESLDNDRRKENKKSEVNKMEENVQKRLEQLRQARLENVPPEPHSELPRVRIAVNHIFMGKIVRSFSVRDNMQAVYDWVGSCALHPEHFNLSQCQGQVISPSDPIANVANCTLYMEVSTSPVEVCEQQEVLASENDILPDTTRSVVPDILMEDDKPLSESERSSKEHYSHLEEKRKSAYDKLQDVRKVKVTKDNIMKDLIELYKDPSIINSRLLMEIAGQEDAVGSGVLREAYSLFWDNLLANNTMGETEFTIPMAPHFTCEDYVSIGRIITHQFVQCGAFPVRISQASITQALVGDVSPEMLISSFLKLLPPREREIVEKGLSNSTAFSQDEIMEILEDYNINTLPTAANLASLITQIGRNELAQKPYLYLLRIRRGMGPMWDGVNEEEIASIYNLCQPTTQRIIDQIYMVQKDPKDGQIMRWLQRYLKICSDEALVNFLRFCTATDVMRPECRIKVCTEFMPPAAIRPKSRTCFGIIILPRNYTSFAQLRKNLDFYLRNPNLWDLSD